jgi:hypothetical protein
MHRPIRRRTALTGQQLRDLRRRQRPPFRLVGPIRVTAGDPSLQPVAARLQQVPRGPVARRPARPDLRDHQADQLVVDLPARPAGQARLLRRPNISAGRLPVHPSRLGGLPQTLPAHPAAQHLTNLEHIDLPETHIGFLSGHGL